MKTRKSVLCVVLSLGVLFFLSSCETTKTPLPTDNIDELLGTWVNPAYEGSETHRAKGVYKEDGTILWHHYEIKSGHNHVYYMEVEEKWMDRSGNVYFKAFFVRYEGSTTNVLIKINVDRKTLEILEASRVELLPAEMDTDAPYCAYYILYRQ